MRKKADGSKSEKNVSPSKITSSMVAAYVGRRETVLRPYEVVMEICVSCVSMQATVQ